MLLCQCSPLLSLDDLVCSIAFICNKHLCYVRISMLIYLLEPIGDVIERLLVSTVVNENDPHSSLVVSLSNGSKSLLTCCIPHLQLHPLIVYIDLLDLEVDS